MIQGIKWGRIEKIVSGATTYLYTHVDADASDDATDWYATRIVTSGSNKSIVMKRGSFGNYAADWS